MRFRDFLRSTRAQGQGMDLPGVMILLVVAGVIGFIGLQVMSTVINTAGIAGNQPLAGAEDNFTTAIEDSWGLIGVAFIVVVLAVIVVYLYGIRGRR